MKRVSRFLPLASLIFLSFLLFIPKLGQTPLKSWDEAWYAEIARNILKKGDWFLLWWNGLPYYDHPPAGFWLMALSFKFLGINELTARLASAFTGIGSIFLIYLIGKELFGVKTGLAAGIILATMPWFWLRAREGNLDIILTFFVLLSIWSAAKIKKNPKFFLLLSFCLAFALLTKTVIAAGIAPILAWQVFQSKSKIDKKSWFGAISIFLIISLPWYLANYSTYGPKFLERNIFITGLKLPGFGAIFPGNFPPAFSFKNTFYNLHMGILLWYKPFLVCLLGSLIFLKNKSFRLLYLWLVPYILIFSFSAKIELWHLIIIYPAVALLISAFLMRVAKILPFAFIISLLFVLWNGGRIVKGLYRDIIKSQPANDEVILSRLASQNNGIIYIDDDYWPAAVFYSQRKVYSIPHSTDTNIKDIKTLFSQGQKPFLLLTKQWILGRDEINPKNYEVLKKIGERVLIKSLN